MTNIEKIDILKRIDELQKGLELLRQDIIKMIKTSQKKKISLFGSVKGDDITEEMIEEAKHHLFRGFENTK